MGPNILVMADDWDERALISSTLAEAGFAAVAVADEAGAAAALQHERFAAAVLAPDVDDMSGLLYAMRRRAPDLPVLLLVEPAAMRLDDEWDAATTIVKRPFDLRQLLGCVFGLVLRDIDGSGAARHSHAAEMGIAAAQLACLYNRRTAAAATGADRLAQDLTQQIGHVQTAYRGLSAAVSAD